MPFSIVNYITEIFIYHICFLIIRLRRGCKPILNVNQSLSQCSATIKVYLSTIIEIHRITGVNFNRREAGQYKLIYGTYPI